MMVTSRWRCLLVMAGVACSAAALAQDGNRAGTPYDVDGQAHYDYARVVRVEPIIVAAGDDYGTCYQRDYADDVYGSGTPPQGRYRRDDGFRDDGVVRRGSDGGRQLATVIGGVAGAVLGSQVGGGDGRYLGSALGGLLGGTAGRAIYEASTREPDYRQGNVRVCEPAPYRADGAGDERMDGYWVTYEYGGRTYRTRRDEPPGEHIRVRVDVTAD